MAENLGQQSGTPSGAGALTLRRSEFLVVAESLFQNQWLMFSTHTGALETVSTERLAELEAAIAEPSRSASADVVWLQERGFLVDFDERDRMRTGYLQMREQVRNQPLGGLSLTIAPTVRCNFACTYCFEKHPERDLTDQDSDGLTRFVEQRLEEGTYLAVTWFGGEPLLQFSALKQTYERLHAIAVARSCAFQHSIITNGSLLKGERLDFLERTKIQSVQVTLDGIAAIHDRRRWSSGKKGTYELIMQNLAGAARRVPIQLRINVDKRNCGYLLDLLDDLEARGLKGFIFPYLGHVEAYTEEAEECENPDQWLLTREEFARIEFEFKVAIWRRGFGAAPSLPSPRTGFLCTADSPNSFVVSPRGALFDCWNETALDPERARHRIDANGKLVVNDASPQRDWTRYDPFAHEECRRCIVQPMCKGGCPWEAAKHPPHLTGNCSPLRWTLVDQLRIHHLATSLVEQG